MSNKCAKCNKIIAGKSKLTCTYCKKGFHHSCTRISEKLFDLIKQKKNNNWKCDNCNIITLREPKTPTTSTTVFSRSTSTPQNFVTQRPKQIVNISTNNSFESLNSDDSEEEDNSTKLSVTLNRSCPTMGLNTSEAIDELKSKVMDLQNKLQTADKEIDELLIENSCLKKQLRYYEKKTTTLSSICRSTPRRERNRKNQTSLNRTALNFTCLEQVKGKHESPKIDKAVEQSKLNESVENKRKKTMPPKTVESPAADTGNSNQCKINQNADTTEKRKVAVFSDQHGKGIRNALEFLLGKDFHVTAILKPYAQIDQILSSCNKICKDFTNKDCVIVIAGSNDKNPSRFQSYIYYYLSLFVNTNVLVGEISENMTLNVHKLNEVLRLACSHFKNTAFVPLHYDNPIPNRKQYTGRLLLKEILAIDYKYRYINHIDKMEKEADAINDNVRKEKKFQCTIPYLFNKMKQNQTKNKETIKDKIDDQTFFRDQKKQ